MVAGAYGITLTSEELENLKNEFPRITKNLLQRDPESGRRLGQTEATAGSIIGAILGTVVGGIVCGPPCAIAGAAIGIKAGEGIGANLSYDVPHPKYSGLISSSNPLALRTLVHITPAGGPYSNQKLWEDIAKATHFPQIGSVALKFAGCLLTPIHGNNVQVWLPASDEEVNFIQNDEKWPPIIRPDGTKVYMGIFVVVMVPTHHRGRDLRPAQYQMRVYPYTSYIHGPDRPNHSQLTQGSRLLGLIGGEGMNVYAAGEVYLVNNVIVGLLSTTGHYFNHTNTFNDEVYRTTNSMLSALGYDVSNIKTGTNLTNWLNDISV